MKLEDGTPSATPSNSVDNSQGGTSSQGGNKAPVTLKEVQVIKEKGNQVQDMQIQTVNPSGSAGSGPPGKDKLGRSIHGLPPAAAEAA